jgi:hypothetical protein
MNVGGKDQMGRRPSRGKAELLGKTLRFEKEREGKEGEISLPGSAERAPKRS